jgi:hypothetical protein
MMSDEEKRRKADEILAAGNEESVDMPRLVQLDVEFSGTDCAGSPWGEDWLAFTDGEYYHRIRGIMLKYGMVEGDVEMIIANAWEDGWTRAHRIFQS